MIHNDLEVFIYRYIDSKYPINKKVVIPGNLIRDYEAYKRFLMDYSATFGVDISEFKTRESFLNPDKAELTIGDLERGIVLSRLDDQIINLKNDEQLLSPKLSWISILKGAAILLLITMLLIFVAFFI
ncbi:MAG TPA: hypothetical protein DIT04_11195 [Dysgonomonas sp.]|nr:hypothetical protein [Dysgonomonas sp.]